MTHLSLDDHQRARPLSERRKKEEGRCSKHSEHHFGMFPHRQEGPYETDRSLRERPSLLPPRLPRLSSHSSNHHAPVTPTDAAMACYRHYPPQDRLEGRSRPFSGESRALRMELPGVATLMMPHTQQSRPLYRTNSSRVSYPEQQQVTRQQLPGFECERRRAQSLPQPHVCSNLTSVSSPMTSYVRYDAPPNASRLSQRWNGPTPAPDHSNIRLNGLDQRHYAASPTSRGTRWAPYASVSAPPTTRLSLQSPVGAPQAIALSWNDEEEDFEAEDTRRSQRRRRTSPRRRLAASKARARAWASTMDAAPTGLTGSLPMDYPSYEGRSFEATAAPYTAKPSMPLPLPLPQPLRLPSSQLVEEVAGQKSSRYLREMDRRTILARLDRGEKQSALAKEFRVTRAAICNLNKHRDLVLARRHEDPLAKHPKKSRRKSEAENDTELEETDAEIRPPLDSALSSPKETSGSGPGRLLPPTVHPVALQPAERLLPMLLSRKTSDAAFRHYCDRLMTLVVEETLAWAHSEAHKEKNSPSGGDAEPLKSCGVAVEPQGSPLLSVFQALEPELPTGRIQLALPRLVAPVAAVLELPAALEAHNVCLFYAFTDAAGGLRVAESIRALLDRGAVEELLCLVTLAVSTLTVGELQRAHPSLRIAAAHVERPEDVDDWIRDDRELQSRADTRVEMKDSSEPSRLSSRLELLAARVNEVY